MNCRINRLARLRSTSGSRSRSVTPTPERARQRPSAARRALMMGLISGNEARDPQVESSPKRRQIQALEVTCTPGGSLNVTGDTVAIQSTPGGNLRRAAQGTDDEPLCSDVLEKIEAMDMSEEETEELLRVAPWHVQRWVGASEPEEQRESAESTSPAATFTVIHEAEVYPSTSGVTVTSKPTSGQKSCEGSDLDSEFDDEFDVSRIETTSLTAFRKDIPDDLDAPTLRIINDVARGMDDATDRLPGISPVYNWVEGFESFRGVPEQFSGPTPGPVRDYDSAYDAFTDIWSEDIIGRIVVETNKYAKQTIEDLKSRGKLKPSSRLHKWTDTNADEVMILFSIFMYMAIDPRTSQSEFWITGVLGMPVFRRLMSYNRYVLLSKFLHFVDNSDQGQNCQQTGETRQSNSQMSRRLFKLQPIIEHLGHKFDTLYNLKRHISIDESLTLFKGRLSWVQTIRTKAARFGIKSYELCEPKTAYMARFQIYTGKSDGSRSDPSVSVDLGGKSAKVVLELLQGLEHRGHCVTMDNFYNCPALARYLKCSGFDCLGTLRTNRRNVPNDIARIVPKTVEKGTIISRQCGDLSIVSWKDSKLVTIISTWHDDSTCVGSKAGETLIKPVCVKDYNNYMGGIDLKDQKLAMYLLERKRGVKWYIKMFKRLLNVSIHNALVMYVSSLKRRNMLAVTHREFRYELAESIADHHRPRQLEIQEAVGELMRLRRDVFHQPRYECGRNARKRCVICFRSKVHKMVHSQCTTCDVFLCFENCWKEWHTSESLKGQDIRGRKRRRDE